MFVAKDKTNFFCDSDISFTSKRDDWYSFVDIE